jgi:hypothetical protein
MVEMIPVMLPIMVRVSYILRSCTEPSDDLLGVIVGSPESGSLSSIIGCNCAGHIYNRESSQTTRHRGAEYRAKREETVDPTNWQAAFHLALLISSQG